MDENEAFRRDLGKTCAEGALVGILTALACFFIGALTNKEERDA